ncbi:MAG TPA: sigma-70 family RNA polymerase sigma factor [Gaiellaceae bacterium]|nr:sigma-70 family RNA polymerase sigma factor [Gaiellaceae bacterium]
MFRRDPLADPEPLIRRVYAYAAYRLGDGPDAEDVTSETFERAVRYRKSYDPRKGEPVAWLLGIAKRCIDGGWSTSEYATEDLDSPDTTDVEAETIRRLTVSSAVAALDERDRELIALRYGADLTARQIAELLGARTNAIEVALHRALGRLRGILRVDEDEPVRKRGASR